MKEEFKVLALAVEGKQNAYTQAARKRDLENELLQRQIEDLQSELQLMSEQLELGQRQHDTALSALHAQLASSTSLTEQMAATIKELLAKNSLIRFQKNYLTIVNSIYRGFTDSMGPMQVRARPGPWTKVRKVLNAVRFVSRLKKQGQAQSLMREIHGLKPSENPRVTLIRYFAETLHCSNVSHSSFDLERQLKALGRDFNQRVKD